jgi:predicted Zn-dependent peptidase
MLAEKFAAWKPRAVAPIVLPEVKSFVGRKLLLVNKPDSTQTFFRIGNLGISQTDPDRVYLEVINTLFGGRFTSMINSELRIKSGLTYGANSAFDQRRLAGPFVIASYTPNKTTEKALDLALDVLKRLHEKGITAEELQSAKNYIKGQSPTDIETTNQLAELLTRLRFYGLGDSEINEYYQRIDAMTLDDARRVIKQHFPLDNLVFVLIGKAEEIKPILSKYAGQIDQKSIQDIGF